MSREERRERWRQLFENVTTENVSAWRDNFVDALRQVPMPKNELA